MSFGVRRPLGSSAVALDSADRCSVSAVSAVFTVFTVFADFTAYAVLVAFVLIVSAVALFFPGHPEVFEFPRGPPRPPQAFIRPPVSDRFTTQQEERIVTDSKAAESDSAHVDQPIFLDPRGRRRMWLRLTAGVTTGTGVVAVVTCGLLFSERPSSATNSLALPGREIVSSGAMSDVFSLQPGDVRNGAAGGRGDLEPSRERARDDVLGEQVPSEPSPLVPEPSEPLDDALDTAPFEEIHAGGGEESGTGTEASGAELDGTNSENRELQDTHSGAMEFTGTEAEGGSEGEADGTFEVEPGGTETDGSDAEGVEGHAGGEDGVEESTGENSEENTADDGVGYAGGEDGAEGAEEDTDSADGTEPQLAQEIPAPMEVPPRHTFSTEEWFSILDDSLTGPQQLRDR